MDKKNNKRRNDYKLVQVIIILLLLVIALFLVKKIFASDQAVNINEQIEKIDDTEELNKLKEEKIHDIKKINEKLELLGVDKSELENPEEEQTSEKEKDEDPDVKKVHTLPGSGKNHIADTNKIAYKTKEVRDEMYNNGYEGKKLAFLTFDDGVEHNPDYNISTTSNILDVLKEKEVHATFFIMGQKLNDTTGPILKRTYDEGHALATHSFYHDYGSLYPGGSANPDKLVEEHKMVVEAMQTYLGKDFDTKVMRYPGGHLSWSNVEASDKALADIGVEWIDWNAMNGDAQPENPTDPNDVPLPKNQEDVIKNFDHSLNLYSNPNQIVILMHDKDFTAETLGPLIDHIKAEGYEFGILE